MASRAAVVAALARMDARGSDRRIVTPPIEWRESRYSDRCMWCKSKTALLLYEVRQVRRPARSYGIGDHRVDRPAERWSGLSARCVDTVACKARSSAAYEKRQKRSGNLRWAQSRFERADLPKGSCRWCGEPMLYVDDAPYRVKQRQRHRGDEYEVGDRNCRREHNRTFAASPRHLIMHRGDPCCVDCGEAEIYVVPDDGSPGRWQAGNWEADHVIPIEDGGAHDPTNIARRCVRCHREKTNREDAARRARRASASRGSPGRSVTSTSA